MPPQRTIPPAKAVKTERTHEENQERAYIAASRRSDRSLEARVESARRASEIHKRRTGRSLRVTEQDVINEEMYEEEDDDLPLQYRRLTANLQTGSSEFNRRLAAYLTNQLAMRSAVDHAINNSYAQQYPNAPSFAHNQLAAYPSPFYQQQPSFHDESHRYRQAPYPTPNSNMQRMQQHGRAASIATPREMAGFDDAHVNPNMVHTPMVSDQRRMSMPTSSTSPAGVGIPSPAQSMSSGQRPSMSRNPSQQSSHTHHSSQQGDSNQSMPPPRAQPQGFNNAHTDISPFTTSLPHESSQLLLGASVDQGIDPYMSMLMAGSGSGMINPQLFTPSYDMPLSKQRGQQPTLYNNNMGGTLSPSVLDLSQGQPDFGQFPPTGTAPVPTYGQFFDSSFPGFNPEKDHNLTKIDGQDDGNIVNPGLDGDWNTFINGHPWEETAS